MKCKIYHRPKKKIIQRISSIIAPLSPLWFTEDVLFDTQKDLGFQDAFCLFHKRKIVSFLIFTCWDGDIHITLMGTKKEKRNLGYGTVLIEAFFNYVRKLKFNKVIVLTVPPDVNPQYEDTIAFYQKHGFQINKRYQELWQKGAIELTKEL